MFSIFWRRYSRVNQSNVKINVIKFDCKNNFGVWSYEVMNVLTASNLEHALRLQEKPEETSKKDWDNMNRRHVVSLGLI